MNFMIWRLMKARCRGTIMELLIPRLKKARSRIVHLDVVQTILNPQVLMRANLDLDFSYGMHLSASTDLLS